MLLFVLFYCELIRRQHLVNVVEVFEKVRVMTSGLSIIRLYRDSSPKFSCLFSATQSCLKRHIVLTLVTKHYNFVGLEDSAFCGHEDSGC